MKKNIIFFIISIFFLFGCSQNRIETNSQPLGSNQSTTFTNTKKNSIENVQVLNSKSDVQESVVQNLPSYEKIAVVFPSADIDRYALEAVNTVNGYSIQNNKPFKIETFDIYTQNRNNIVKVFDKIKDNDIKKVILLITKEYLNHLESVNNLNDFTIVLPLVNKYELDFKSNLNEMNILYGAISYKEQFKKLLEYGRNYNLVEFYDNSPIGELLHKYLKKAPLRLSKMIDDNNGRYKSILYRNKKKINNSAVILNTPIVKSSILLSAATAEAIKIPVVLSTQLNYTPLLFSLTQINDRKNIVIASSIGDLPGDLREYNNIIGNNVVYNWVNYSSLVAIEYLHSGSLERFEDLSIKDNQIVYPVKLYDVKYYSFKEIR